ncbi:MAG: DUF420 domain-containing protein [Bacteroidetes bacterium]|nr:DUF420 domain-containing protein [Bacteroidota bacterium]
MISPVFKKNDKVARRLIILVSILVFAAIAMLSRFKVSANFGFDVHVFATINAMINSCVSVLLILAFIAIKKRHIKLHRSLMLSAILLSVLFLISYIAHHLFAGDTKFGGEGAIRYFYFFILITHILLASVILPFILFTAYRALSGDYVKHKKMARYTFPLWLYVSITGVLVYLLISPYYT